MRTLSEKRSSPQPARTPRRYAHPRKIEWVSMTPFWLVHLAALGAIFTGITWQAAVCCAVLYVVRMFGVTAGYHRYFSHRSYKTGRLMQFALAFLAETSSQRGVLWWAAHHRHHHRYSDTEKDLHSPRQDGFWYSHMGWIYNGNAGTDLSRVKDLAKYPELVFLNRFWLLPPVMLGVGVWALFGWSGLWFGFMASTVFLWHGTFTINSLSHVFGSQRYKTGDDSRNNFWLALITLGEGWHNNHHYHMNSARQGFFWWEIDMSYYALKVLGWVGLVWDVRVPPAKILNPVPEEREPETLAPEAA